MSACLHRRTQISTFWQMVGVKANLPPWGRLRVAYPRFNDLDDTNGIYLMKPSTLSLIAFLLNMDQVDGLSVPHPWPAGKTTDYKTKSMTSLEYNLG